jgi:hypothetical protein
VACSHSSNENDPEFERLFHSQLLQENLREIKFTGYYLITPAPAPLRNLHSLKKITIDSGWEPYAHHRKHLLAECLAMPVLRKCIFNIRVALNSIPVDMFTFARELFRSHKTFETLIVRCGQTTIDTSEKDVAIFRSELATMNRLIPADFRVYSSW